MSKKRKKALMETICFFVYTKKKALDVYKRQLKAIKDDAFVVALAIEGKGLTSEGLADFMAKKAVDVYKRQARRLFVLTKLAH